MQCPQCAAPIDWASRYAVVMSCSSCRATLKASDDVLSVLGTSSVLPQSDLGLAVGSTLSLKHDIFQIVGRVRYQHHGGFWDEWYLQSQGDKAAWLAEDEGQVTLMQEAPNHALAHSDSPKQNLRLGAWIDIAGLEYQVQEANTALCVGLEGALPFVQIPDETIHYIALRHDQHQVATLEEDEDGRRLFVGRTIPRESIVVEGFRPPNDAPESFRSHAAGALRAKNCMACGGELNSEGGVNELNCDYCGTINTLNVFSLDCPNCDAVFPLICDEAKFARCPKCEVGLDLQGESASLISKEKIELPNTPLKLGARGTFDGQEFVITGITLGFTKDEWGPYYFANYQLYNKTQGYKSLSESDGHYTLEHRLATVPPKVVPTQRRKFSFADREWKLFESSIVEVAGVYGQLPYLSRVGDKMSFWEAISPPYVLLREWTEQEVEAYQGVYLKRREVEEAFKLDAGSLPKPKNTPVGAAQPFELSSFKKNLRGIGKFGFVAFLLLLIFTSGSGKKVYQNTFTIGELEGEVISEVFSLKGPVSVLEVDTQVSDSWTTIDLALIDRQSNELVAEMGTELSYYSGYEGGEFWSEGSSSDSMVIPIKKKSDYQLVLRSGETQYQGQVQISIVDGVILHRYFVFGLVLCALMFIASLIGQFSFESRRWSDSDYPFAEED